MSSWGAVEEAVVEDCMALLRYSYFFFGGCAVIESDKVGWIDRWGGAVIWDEREMFDCGLLGLPIV